MYYQCIINVMYSIKWTKVDLRPPGKTRARPAKPVETPAKPGKAETHTTSDTTPTPCPYKTQASEVAGKKTTEMSQAHRPGRNLCYWRALLPNKEEDVTDRYVQFASNISPCLVNGLKESVFVLEILTDLGYEFESLPGFTDSKSGYDTVLNPGVTKRTAHFERWLYYAREMYLANKLLLSLVKDEEMMADALSKITDRVKFFKCRDAWGIQ